MITPQPEERVFVPRPEEPVIAPRPEEPDDRVVGTHDGEGAGDHDQPYRFGCRPSVAATYPFSMRQYARLLLLRSRLQARHAAAA